MTIQLITGTENEDTFVKLINTNFAGLETSFVDVPDMNPVSSIDGTELIALTQNGVGKRATAQLISGDPVTARRGLKRNFVQDFSDFSRTPSTFLTATDDVLFGNEDFICYVGNGGSVRQASPSLLFLSGALLITSTASNGYAGVQHTQGPLYFQGTGVQDWDQQFTFRGNQLSAGGQLSTLRSGFLAFSAFPTVVSNGMYFEYNESNAAIMACVTNAGTSTKLTTGVNFVAGTAYTGRVIYDKLAFATKFYLDGNLVQTIPDGTRVAGAGILTMATVLNKTLGAVSHSGIALYHKFKIEQVILANY